MAKYFGNIYDKDNSRVKWVSSRKRQFIHRRKTNANKHIVKSLNFKNNQENIKPNNLFLSFFHQLSKVSFYWWHYGLNSEPHAC
jgi:hypothetical protein